MSSADGKWELGVVAWSDSFEEFDQFTRVKTAYSAPTNISDTSNTLALDDTISSDYRNSPFYLHGNIHEDAIRGSELIVGPSSNSTYEGAVDRAIVDAFTNGYTFYLDGNATNYSVDHALSAAFSVNDPVLVRTVPLNWSLSGSNTLHALSLACKPISRYDESFVDVVNQSASNVDIDVSSAYNYFNQKAVRLATRTSTSNSARYILRKTGVNTISPYINRYRVGWYYRLGKANPRIAGTFNANGLDANIKLKALDAAGNTLTALTGESLGEVQYTAGAYPTSNDLKDVFTFGSATFGLYKPSTSSAPSWNLVDLTSETNPNKYAATRINQLEVQVGLYAGLNAAFDVDDMVIEHAQGTSGEDEGFCTINHYPETGSISWQYRRPSESASSTANNVMRKVISTGNKKPKHIINASFDNAPIQTYLDMKTLIGWQDRGNLLSLRTFHEGLPNVAVGYLTITSFNNQMWDLGRVSFGLRFEEA